VRAERVQLVEGGPRHRNVLEIIQLAGIDREALPVTDMAAAVRPRDFDGVIVEPPSPHLGCDRVASG
jgi:hypothetical protein